MFKNEKNKADFYQFATVILLLVIVYFYFSLKTIKEEFAQYRNQSVQEFIATRYCTSLKYKESSWKESFDNCLKEATNNPRDFLDKYLNTLSR